MEFFKIAYVFFMSWWMLRKQHLLNSSKILTRFFVINSLILGIFLFIPDLGAVLIMGIVGIIIAIYAGVSIKNMLKMFIVAAGIGGIGIWSFLGLINNSCSINTPKEERSFICKYSYIAKRIEVYIDPSSDETGQNMSWQGRNALIAIGGGGWFGNGYGK